MLYCMCFHHRILHCCVQYYDITFTSELSCSHWIVNYRSKKAGLRRAFWKIACHHCVCNQHHHMHLSLINHDIHTKWVSQSLHQTLQALLCCMIVGLRWMHGICCNTTCMIQAVKESDHVQSQKKYKFKVKSTWPKVMPTISLPFLITSLAIVENWWNMW